MIPPSLRVPAWPVPEKYRSNFLHLYLDVAWFGLLGGSAMAFVAVYATRQGANAFQIGLLSAGPALVNLLFALPAGRWLERQPMGAAVFWTSVFHRLFYLMWVPLPVLLAPQAQIWTLIGLTLLMGAPGVTLAIGFNALFADAVPVEWRGHVAGVRNGLLAITFTITSLLCGYILNHYPFPVGYQIVFAMGFLGGAMSSVHLWFVRPYPDGVVPPRVGRSLGDLALPGMIRTLGEGVRSAVGLRFLTRAHGLPMLRTEILRGHFGRIFAVTFAFHLAQYLPIALFPLYVVNRLHLNDQQIALGAALFYATVFLGSTRLAHLTRQLGNHWLVTVGALLMTLYPGMLAISRGFGMYVALSLMGGFAWALAGGALNNYLLDKVPQDDRPAHLAWYNLALNAAILLGSLLGPLIGGMLGLSLALGIFAGCRLLAALFIWRWG
jgi:MFS family permease